LPILNAGSFGVVGGIAMSCVIDLTDRRRNTKFPKWLAHPAGIVLPFTRKSKCASHFSGGVQRTLFRRIRHSNGEYLPDAVVEAQLREMSESS
jgi:hypothetical protein